MTTTRTILSQMEILNESRIVVAHFMLAVYDDAGNEIARSKGPHTVSLMPGDDLSGILDAVNADLTTRAGMGWPAIDPADWRRVCDHCVTEQTPEVIEAYKASVETKRPA